MVYDWNFDVIWQYRGVYWNGALVTLALSFSSLFFAMVLGLIVGIARQSKTRAISFPASWYVEIIRDTPLLVQIIWIFYCLPILIGVEMTAFWSAVITISVHFSAYIAEIIRAGIASIDKGQVDATKVLGLSYFQAMKRIVLPQAYRRMLPPLVNNFADLIKLSALASIIGVYELLHSIDNIIMHTFRPLELYSTLAILYFIIIFPVAFGARLMESYYARRF